MADVDLSHAAWLAPEQAVEYFWRRGYMFSWDWTDTWHDAHARAFTVLQRQCA